MPQRFKVVDAHVAGAPIRLLVDGVPAPAGMTMEKRRAWMQRRADHVRRATLLEPRGHRDLVGALLTEPVSRDADAGLLFLDPAGYPVYNASAVVAAATIAIEQGLITRAGSASRPTAADPVAGPDSDMVTLVFDTPGGTVHATADWTSGGAGARVDSVQVSGIASFVVYAGCPVVVGGRSLRVDLAHAGAFVAIVDSEATGIPLIPERLADLRQLGAEICRAFDGHEALVHPVDAYERLLGGVVFTAPPQLPEAHLRTVSISPDGGCERSGLTGATAVMAVLNAMGLLEDGYEFVYEGLLKLTSRGSVARLARIGDYPAIVGEVEASAWITGEQTLTIDDRDPLAAGFVL